MAERPTQDQSECSAASVQKPHSLHSELPNVNPDDVFLIISKCLLDIPIEHGELLKSNFVTCDTLTALAASCMDVVQKLAEGILDIVIPQIYSHMRSHGSISMADFRVTEDQIQAYMGDSVEQALTFGLKINVRFFSHTKVFSQLLQEHILRTVNSVVALFTQSHTLESRLPVILVSGCVTSITNLKNMVNEMATMLTYALNPQQRIQRFIDVKSNVDEKCDELDSPLFCFNSRDEFRNQVKAYLIHMLKVLSQSLEKPCQVSPRNKRVVCIRVGNNTKILTVEDTCGHKSPMDSYSDENAIPGSVPEMNKASPSSGSLTIRETVDSSHPVNPMKDIMFISNIVDELMKVFMDGLHTEEETDIEQAAGLQLDTAKEDTIRKITNSIFDLIMSENYCQIPVLLGGRHVGDTITYTRLMRGNIADQGIVAHTVYMRTEEVVTRCAVQMLLWAQLNLQKGDLPSPTLMARELSPEPDFVVETGAAGEYEETAQHHTILLPSLASNASIDVGPEEVGQEDPSSLEAMTRAIKNQLRNLEEPSMSGGNVAKEMSLKNSNRLCCKNILKKANKTTPAIPPPVDGDDLSNRAEVSEEETRRCMCMHRTVSCIRKKCSTLREVVSNFTSAMCRPFNACYKP